MNERTKHRLEIELGVAKTYLDAAINEKLSPAFRNAQAENALREIKSALKSISSEKENCNVRRNQNK